VFDNRVLRRIFEPKRGEVAEGWRKSLDEIHKFYSLSNCVSVIKSRRM
jgi:hypothetical protein